MPRRSIRRGRRGILPATWIVPTAFTISGLVALALAYFYTWTGAYVLIAPLLIAIGFTSGAIVAGLKNPWWVLALMAMILVAFVIIHGFNLFGLGAVL
jgi:hypothetical protein